MNRSDLSGHLYRLGVPPRLYRLDGTHLEGAHVLAQRGSSWVVFLSERGTESDPVTFDDEDKACVYFLGRVVEDLIQRDLLRVLPAPDEARRA